MMRQSLWAVAAAAAFSIMAAFVKLCSVQLPAAELVFYRSVVGAVFIACWAAAAGQTLKTRWLKFHFLRSGLGVLSLALWFWAIPRMQFGTCMTLTYTTPLLMAANFAVLSLMRRQPVAWAMIGCIAAGFAGITFVLKPGFDSAQLVPELVCLTVAAIDLVVYWQMKKMGNLKEPSVRIVFYFCLAGIALGTVVTLASGGFHKPDATTVAGLAGMSVFATIGQICATRSYAYGNMMLTSCLGFSAVPFSAVIGVTCFDDAVDAASVAGMSLIVAAGVTAVITTRRGEEQHPAQKQHGALPPDRAPQKGG